MPVDLRDLTEVAPAYAQLTDVVERTQATNRRLEGVLRLGIVLPMADGPHMTTILDTFKARYPGSEVRVSEPSLVGVLEPLRRGGQSGRRCS